jgi:hypothetical protein
VAGQVSASKEELICGVSYLDISLAIGDSHNKGRFGGMCCFHVHGRRVKGVEGVNGRARSPNEPI